MKKRWVGFDYPTNALAQEAEMSLEEYEDFVFNAVIVDWNKVSKDMDKLKKLYDEKKEVKIVDDDTDLTLSLAGRKGVKGDGSCNMPDGELFFAPIKESLNGHISFSFPAIYGGREVDGVRLEFKNGVIVKATAKKNEAFLKQMIATDDGSKYIGEFGIGYNYNINKFTRNILFDEKIGGTIHLAIGQAYEECGGGNKSAVHWDIIKDLRKTGKIFIDGKLVLNNGKYIF